MSSGPTTDRRELHYLRGLFSTLRKGIAIVDEVLDVALINPTASALLNLPSGAVPLPKFAAALAAMAGRAWGDAGPNGQSTPVRLDVTADVDRTLRFSDRPTHLRVTSAEADGARTGVRVWTFDDVSALSEALEDSETNRALLRASADGMLDPQVLMEAVRDPDGRLVDFVYRSVNRATALYLSLTEADLLDRRAMDTLPNLEGSGLFARYEICLRTGEPVALRDFFYFNEILEDSRCYDIYATRAGPDLLNLTWSDVTERFRARARLEASETRYRLLAENSGDVICHLRDDVIVWISPSAEGLLGAPPDYWVGRDVAELVAPEEVTAHSARVAALTAGGAVKERARVKTRDGTLRWFHLYAQPYLDADGQPDGVAAALRPIDDEVAAEQAAEAAQKAQSQADIRFRRSMDNAAVGMCLATPDGHFYEVNETLCQFFGHDAETLKRKTWQELTAPGDLEADLGYVDEVVAGRRDSYRMVKQYVHSDGHLVWGDLAVSCIRDDSGAVEMFVAQIADITAATEALERNRLLARHLQHQTDRLTAELHSAASYMSSIMPRGLRGRVKVSSRYLPSRALGGDCYDYRWIDDDHLILYLIDVSGHGIEPALLSASLQNMLRSGSFPTETLRRPEIMLAELNRLFQMESQNQHYFTMWFGAYQHSTRTLRYASAGAPPALAISAPDAPTLSITELSTLATPVGMWEATTFPARTHRVVPGSRLLLCSDGAVDITLPGGRHLSWTEFKGLVAGLARTRTGLLDELIENLQALNPAADFEDDFSMIQVTFT